MMRQTTHTMRLLNPDESMLLGNERFLKNKEKNHFSGIYHHIYITQERISK